MAQPSGLIAKAGIELLTWGTPNGHKASIILEELKREYGLQYTFQAINIGQNVQKQPWFTAVNPNGRIPAIVDHDNKDLSVFEGSAILSYLTRKYDTKHVFSFDPADDDYTNAESWIGFQHGGIGPMQGQAGHFLRAAPEHIPYGVQRYVGETERLYGVLNARLADRDYIVGPGRGKYSIADISFLGWANFSSLLPIDLGERFPAVKAWLDRCYERPAVKAGMSIPGPPAVAPDQTPSEEQAKKYAEGKKLVDAAKAQYGYKYSSP